MQLYSMFALITRTKACTGLYSQACLMWKPLSCSIPVNYFIERALLIIDTSSLRDLTCLNLKIIIFNLHYMKMQQDGYENISHRYLE